MPTMKAAILWHFNPETDLVSIRTSQSGEQIVGLQKKMRQVSPQKPEADATAY
jgi:hypothetical protein